MAVPSVVDGCAASAQKHVFAPRRSGQTAQMIRLLLVPTLNAIVGVRTRFSAAVWMLVITSAFLRRPGEPLTKPMR